MRPAAASGFSAVATLAMCTLIVFMIVPENADYRALGSAMPQSGNTISRLVWIGLIGAGALVVLRYLSLARLVLRELNPFLVAFVILAAASLWWSIDAQFTARRLLRLATILFVTSAFVLAHGPRVQDVLRPMFTAMLVGSIGMVLLFPAFALERSPSPELAGAWHGLATQKNGLGSLAAIGTLCWIHAVMTRESRWVRAAAGLAVSLVCLVFSRSSTAMLATVLTVPLFVILLRAGPGLHRFVPWIVGLYASGLMLYSLAVLRLIPGFGILLRPIGVLTDKDPTFSGRIAIWNIVSENIALNPFLGSGFGAYWVGPIMGTASFEHVTRLYFYPTEAHNGVLDVVNDLGVLGGICLLGYLIVYLRQAHRVYARRRALGALFIGLFFLQVIENMSESRWFNVLCVQFVVLTLATVALARAQLEIRLQERVRSHEHGTGAARRRVISAWA